MIEQKLNIPKHVKRMIKEKFKLDKKIHKLNKFIEEQSGTTEKPLVDKQQLDMLISQRKFMEQYGTILRERVMYDATEEMKRKNKIPENTMMSKIDIEAEVVQHYTTSEEDQRIVASELIHGVLNAVK